jgi:hypothetical protein
MRGTHCYRSDLSRNNLQFVKGRSTTTTTQEVVSRDEVTHNNRSSAHITCFKCGGRGHTRDVCPSRSERSHNASTAQQQPAPTPDFFGRAFFGFSERVSQEDIDFLLNQDSPVVDDVFPTDLPDLVTDSDSDSEDDDSFYSNPAPAVVDNAFPTDVPDLVSDSDSG